MTPRRQLQRAALLSVTDREGLVPLARELHRRGLLLVATAGTAKALEAAGLPVTSAGELSGVGELFGGRVKTLTPQVMGGILARRGEPDDEKALRRLKAPRFDAVVCNLYQLKDDPDSIDIGGVALIRAAAKNCGDVAVAVRPEDYVLLLAALAEDGLPDAAREERAELRRRLASRAWRYVADYDTAIAARFGEREVPPPPAAAEATALTLSLRRHATLRYGENPHQAATWWVHETRGLHEAKLVRGPELSFNNVLDLANAQALVLDLGADAAAVVKHQTPCGAARLASPAASLAAAIATDSLSAFGGVIALAGVCDAAAVEALGELFVEAIVAAGFSADALARLEKRRKLRLLEWPAPHWPATEWRSVPGGLLQQERDTRFANKAELRVVTRRTPTVLELRDLRFAEIVAKHARSNAIALARDGVTVGIGAGETSRVDAVREAMRRAGDRASGAVLASDAFFPFADGLEAAPGITAVIQPGGSVRDAEVIAAADRLGLAMVFTGVRHFKH